MATAKKPIDKRKERKAFLDGLKKEESVLKKAGKEKAPSGFTKPDEVIKAFALKAGGQTSVKSKLTSINYGIWPKKDKKPAERYVSFQFVSIGENAGTTYSISIGFNPVGRKTTEQIMKNICFTLQRLGFDTDNITFEKLVDIADEYAKTTDKIVCVCRLKCTANTTKGQPPYLNVDVLRIIEEDEDDDSEDDEDSEFEDDDEDEDDSDDSDDDSEEDDDEDSDEDDSDEDDSEDDDEDEDSDEDDEEEEDEEEDDEEDDEEDEAPKTRRVLKKPNKGKATKAKKEPEPEEDDEDEEEDEEDDESEFDSEDPSTWVGRSCKAKPNGTKKATYEITDYVARGKKLKIKNKAGKSFTISHLNVEVIAP